MKPLDPRLLRLIRELPGARSLLWVTVSAGMLNAALLVIQALLIAAVIEAGMRGGNLTGWLVALSFAVVSRALLNWVSEVAAVRLAVVVKARLRTDLVNNAVRKGPQWLASQHIGELATLSTTGLDAVDDYFARYLPAVILAGAVPLSVVGTLAVLDLSVAATVVVTLPLIPLFAALIGWATQRHTERQWRVLTTLSGHFLDVVAGLPTLLVFGRAQAQITAIEKVTEQHRKASMRTLRLAFLSSGALELVATISVALVAVSVGLRLLDGGIGFFTAVAILVLVPEAYWPLRRVGAEYHAAAGGIAVVDRVLALGAGQSRVAVAKSRVPSTAGVVIRVKGISVAGRLEPVSFDIPPRHIVGISGDSGCGKTTLFAVLLGFLAPTTGAVEIGKRAVETYSEDWRARLAWMPQHPYVGPGEVWRNVALGGAKTSKTAAIAALERVGIAELADRKVGDDGAGLSAGQRQRVALARVLVRCARLTDGVVLFDEPTAFLDQETERIIVEILTELRQNHRVVLVAHRASLLAAADQIVRIGEEKLAAVPV